MRLGPGESGRLRVGNKTGIRPDWGGGRGPAQGLSLSRVGYQSWIGYQMVDGIPDSRWDTR